MKYTASMKQNIVEVVESWTGDHGSYEFGFGRSGHNYTEVWIFPKVWGGSHMPQIRFQPESVAEVRLMAKVLPPMLRMIADEMESAMVFAPQRKVER